MTRIRASLFTGEQLAMATNSLSLQDALVPIAQLEHFLTRLRDLHWTFNSLAHSVKEQHVLETMATANNAITLVIRWYEHQLWHAQLNLRRVLQDHLNQRGHLPCMDEI